jgi:2-keto-4-pentenoate hydratase
MTVTGATLTATEVSEAASLLLSAYRAGITVPPLTGKWPDMTSVDAYAVQQAQVTHWLANGDSVAGHKVGLTSAAMRRQFGVADPDFGHLLSSMFCAEASPIPVGRFLQPRVQPEIAFVLRKPLTGPGVTTATAAAAIDFVLPALEITDSRITDWRLTLADTIADNASCGAVVLGTKPTLPSAVDLRLAGCVLHRNGALAATGAGGAVLGSPLNAVAWLANALGSRGVTLRAGDVVLAGSMTAALEVWPGATVSASVAGLGSVTARFGEGKSA